MAGVYKAMPRIQIETQIFEVPCWMCGAQKHIPVPTGFNGWVSFNCCDENQSHKVGAKLIISLKSSTEPL